MSTCTVCGGQGEVPTPDTAHLAAIRIGGFEHPDMEFTMCQPCGGTGQVEAVPA